MKVAVVVAAAALLAACARPPDVLRPDPDFEIPAAWTADDAESSEDLLPRDWWVELGDTELAAIVEEALASNYDLQAAVARLDQALAISRIEGADRYPRLGANLDFSRRKQIFIGFPVEGGTTSSQWGASLDVSWELDLWGRLRARKSAALAQIEGARADALGARLSIAAQTAKAWFATIEARDLLALAAETARSYATSADQVRARYERGVRSSLDLRLALSERAGANALVEARSNQLDSAKRQLETLVGRYPAGALVGRGELPELASEVPAGLPVEILARRPDIALAERNLAAAGARVREARAALFPRLSLIGSRGRVGEKIGDLLEPDLGIWSFAANLTQPLFEGGRLRGNLELEDARRRETLAAYFKEVLDAYREVESLLATERLLAARETRLAERAEQARAARRLAENRYLSGLEDYITVLESQRTSLAAQSEWISIRRERLDSRVDLYLSLGGGFDRAEIRSPLAAGPEPARLTAARGDRR